MIKYIFQVCTEQTRLNPQELLKAIRTRRTIRQFQEKDIPKEIVHQIVEDGRLAPTGGNAQNISYVMRGVSNGIFLKIAIQNAQ